MRQIFKNTISISLLLLFITPIVAKFGDAIFHHHEHFHCTTHCGIYYDEQHSECPILKYEVNSLADKIQEIEFESIVFFKSIVNQLQSFVYTTQRTLSIFLRAPPLI